MELVTVKTPFGPVVGTRQDGVAAFRRVRYALPPVGERRFSEPGAPVLWKTEYDASRPGVIPPQLPSRLDAVMGSYDATQDEDCLHLDIWSCPSSYSAAPVVVFLHGGAFVTGGGSLPCYDGHSLAKMGAVVVNISYRLGIFGFLSVPGVAAPNLGLRDQIAALLWIKEGIRSFGGDPDRITLVGQSAGAYSIAAMMMNSRVKGIFKRAVLMSAPLGMPIRECRDMVPVADGLVAALGAAPGAYGALKDAPVSELLSAMKDMMSSARVSLIPGNMTLPLMPVIDHETLGTDPVIAAQMGAGAWCESIVGVTRDEFNAFAFGNREFEELAEGALQAEFDRLFGERGGELLLAASAIRAPATPTQILADVRTDAVFTNPNFDFATAQAKHGTATYMYVFDWQSPEPRLGACHCIDLPFLFGNFDVWRSACMIHGAPKRELADLSRHFQSALIAFANSGNPNDAPVSHWPQVDPTGTHMRFGRITRSWQNLLGI